MLGTAEYLRAMIPFLRDAFELALKEKAESQFASSNVEISPYLLVLLEEEDDELAFSWMRPIPTPPTAPASSPSKTSTGRLSSSDFFLFPTIRYSPSESRLSSVILALAVPLALRNRDPKTLQGQKMYPEARPTVMIVQTFSPKRNGATYRSGSKNP